jgi:hypothetical protein
MQHSPKLAILQSLDSMDSVQMEEVLKHIKGILNRTTTYQVSKSEAMKEIAQALKSSRSTGIQQVA